jgi:hypothetical protein
MFVGVVPHEFEPAINDEHVMAVWVDPGHLDKSKLFWATQQFFTRRAFALDILDEALVKAAASGLS